VQVPRGMQRVVNADVAWKREKTYPATYHGGVRLTRHRGWRGTPPPISQKRVGNLASCILCSINYSDLTLLCSDPEPTILIVLILVQSYSYRYTIPVGGIVLLTSRRYRARFRINRAARLMLLTFVAWMWFNFRVTSGDKFRVCLVREIFWLWLR
jgi:hypothetical protein